MCVYVVAAEQGEVRPSLEGEEHPRAQWRYCVRWEDKDQQMSVTSVITEPL